MTPEKRELIGQVVAEYEEAMGQPPVADPGAEALDKKRMLQDKHFVRSNNVAREVSRNGTPRHLKISAYNRDNLSTRVEEAAYDGPEPDFSGTAIDYNPEPSKNGSHPEKTVYGASKVPRVKYMEGKSLLQTERDDFRLNQYRSMIDGVAGREIADIFVEDQTRGNHHGPEPTQIKAPLYSNPRKNMSPVQDSFDHESKP